MKRSISLILALLMIAGLTACGKSNIKAEESGTVPEDVLVIRNGKAVTKAATQKYIEATKSTYSIPADAETGESGGPGVMETKRDDTFDRYPADKQPGETAEGTVICIYQLDEAGVHQDFDIVDMCDADSMINCLILNYTLDGDTKVLQFSAAGGAGKLEINSLKGVYKKAKPEQLTACIANTFIENLDITSLEIIADGQTLGVFEYSDKYNAT